MRVETRALEHGAYGRNELRRLDLAGREVHRDLDLIATGQLGPSRRLDARLLEDPPAHRNDEAALLGQRDEVDRRHETMTGTMPTDERLDMGHRPIAQSHDGLEVELELTV